MTAAEWIPVGFLPAGLILALLSPQPSIAPGPCGLTVVVQPGDPQSLAAIERVGNALRRGVPRAGRASVIVPAACVEVTA